MKFRIFSLALLLILLTAFNKVGHLHTLYVKIDNIVLKKGTLYIAIYANKDNFLKNPFMKIRIKVQSSKINCEFKNVPDGEYSMAIFQDLNENKKLDKILFMPIEPYGFSGNGKGSIGTPTYENTKFFCKNDITLTIQLTN